jgi:DNA repair exonuclease SbcCD ATPase subunit
MTLSGPEALRSLDDALRDIRREEDEIAKRLSRSSDLIARFRETEGELLRQLAAVRLDPANQAELSGQLSRAEERARELFRQHARDLRSAEEQLKARDKAIAAMVKERAALAARAGDLEAELETLAAKVAATDRSPEFAEQLRKAEELQRVAEESLRKTAQAEADREQKGRPYRDDPLFMYLWERSYGTSHYRANNLVRWLDGLVAQLVRYHEARPNFAMLNEIPLRLREHAERQQQKALAAQEELAKLEQAAVDAAGGAPLREELEQAEARIATIDSELVVLEDERDAAAQVRRELAQGRDPAFAEAVAALAEGLGREDIQLLLEQARATQTGQDDTIVKQIDDARSRAQEELSETEEQKARLQTLAARRRELEDIEYEFKRARFDDRRSSFRQDELVGDLLNDFLRGGISAAAYWDAWRRSQHWHGDDDHDEDSDHDGDRLGPWSGGFRWPEGSIGGGGSGRRSGGGRNWGRLPGLGGGGFSRPRGGSAGARRHGGFKTGGGF